MDKTNFSAFCLIVLVAFAIAMCSVMFVGYTINNENIAFADDVLTDLTGSTWVPKSNWNNDALDYNACVSLYDFQPVNVNISFTNNLNESYSGSSISCRYDDGDYYMEVGSYYFITSDGSYYPLTFSISGGSGATNSTFINWCYTYFDLVVPDEPDEPDEPSEPDEPDEPSNPSQDYLDGYADGYDAGRGSIYTGTFSDYTIFSDYSSLGINNNDLNISDSSDVLSSPVIYSNFTINGYTINYQRIDIVGSYDDTGKYTLTLTGTTGYSGYKVSSFNIDENSLYKFMFNPTDSFNICISVPNGNGTYSYWTYPLQTDGYINGVPYMDLTPYIKPWVAYVTCDIYLYNPNLRSLGGEPQPLVLHNTTPIYGLVANNLIVDNSNGNYNQGYQDGYNSGSYSGYNRGYNDAIENSSSSSFLGLFTAVIDAPVQVISQSLDFDLLGFNLKDFLFSMMSLAIVLFIIRLIL